MPDGEKRNRIRRVMIFVNALNGAYARLSKKIGIKENTLALLYALDDGGQHSQAKICREWGIPKTTINTIVQECVQKGYVRLTAGSGREKYVRLTESGEIYARELLSCIYASEERAYDRALSRFSAEDLAALEGFAGAFLQEVERIEGKISKSV